MANQFPKEIMVAWEKVCEGFEDWLVLSNAVMVGSNYSGTSQERSNDTVWKPIPYIMNSEDGRDQTGNFQDSNGLVVPCRVSYRKSVPWTFTDTELRDPLQLQRVMDAAKQRLASDINKTVSDVATSQGTLVVSLSTAASGYDDVALCDTAMNEQGITMDERYLALSSGDYNKMAGNLAARQTVSGIASRAWEKAYLGEVAGFETLKLDYGNTIPAAAGVTVTIAAADQYYTPAATATALGEEINQDNRYQTISIGVVSGTVAVGDSFTIAGVNSVHQIAKTDTGNLKTFRITEIVTGAGGTGTVKISPPIISAQGATDIEKQYQNVTATPANGAAITFLNTTAKVVNPFWKYDSIELTPGVIMPESAGVETLTYTTEQGIQITLQKQGDINTSTGKYRMDVYYGVTNKNPEMNGILVFDQV
jgi:hypothetical protein